MSTTQELTLVTDIPQQLIQAEVLKDLAVDSSAALVKSFAPHFSSFYKLLPEAKAIAPDAPKAARAMRLRIREVRLDSDKTRVAIKAESLRRSKAIDGIHSLLLNDLSPIEESLTAIEKTEETREAARKEALRVARVAELSPFAEVTFYDLANMPEVSYIQLLQSSKLAHETRLAAAAKAEADRIAAAKVAEDARLAKEAADKAERDRLAAENARLAKEAAATKAAADAAAKKAAKEKADLEAKQAKEKAERDAADKAKEDARKAQEKAEADKRVKEQAAKDAEAAKQKAAADLVAKQEREKREAAEKALADQQKAAADKVAADRAAAKRAAAAPDREKLTAFAKAIRALPIPTLSTAPETQAILAEQVEKFAVYVVKAAAKL